MADGNDARRGCALALFGLILVPLLILLGGQIWPQFLDHEEKDRGR